MKNNFLLELTIHVLYTISISNIYFLKTNFKNEIFNIVLRNIPSSNLIKAN